jgi:hypothetical protein
MRRDARLRGASSLDHFSQIQQHARPKATAAASSNLRTISNCYYGPPTTTALTQPLALSSLANTLISNLINLILHRLLGPLNDPMPLPHEQRRLHPLELLAAGLDDGPAEPLVVTVSVLFASLLQARTLPVVSSTLRTPL